MDAAYLNLLSPEEVTLLVAETTDWALAHGLAVVPPDHRGFAAPAAITLVPSPFPRTSFENALAVQTDYNALYAHAALEHWLGPVIEDIQHVDDFVAKLWNVHKAVKAEGYVQDISLGLFRSDYMVHQDASGHKQILQVEFNTIAASFGGLSACTAQLHRHLLQTGHYDIDGKARFGLSQMPDNPVVENLAAGLAEAHRLYGRKDTAILIVVSEDERNVFDQRHIEHALSSRDPPVPIFRLEFEKILERTTIDEDRRLHFRLHDRKTYEVSVLYFRAGYDPSHYPSEEAWTARLQLERSRAIKCPTVLTHLAGSKKIQEILTQRASLDATFQKLISDRLASSFTSIYPLDETAAGETGRAIALDPRKAAKHVLKPQREGGGHNTYGEDIPGYLATLDPASWKGFVLQELIETAPLRNSILRNGQVNTGQVICELGVYGVCIWKTTGKAVEISHNSEAGWLLRTKAAESHEGGVAAGFGALDSVYLIES